MGAQLVRAVHDNSACQLGAAIVRPGSDALGKDAATLAGLPAAGIACSDNLRPALKNLDVVIDFSRADAVAATVTACRDAGVALMIGTTGLSDATRAVIQQAAARIPVLLSANTSLALNVLLDLARRAAGALPAGYDIEIVETHHRHKLDAPSGTALALGEAAAEGRGQSLPRPVSLTGGLPGPRADGGVGFSVVRGGDVVGEHELRFLGPGEQLRLTHVATDRAIFARGAVAAANWLAGRSAGEYQMADFLFEKQKLTE